MRTMLARGVAFLLVFVFVTSPVWATCGGGGGGGGGGMSGSGSGGGNTVVYHVPWKLPLKPTDKAPSEGLVLYWFPTGVKEIQASSLRESRDLSLYAGQCVSMFYADSTTPKADELMGNSPLPVAVLAKPDGTVIGKAENKNGKLSVGDVEKLVGGEIKTRESGLDTSLKDAKAKAAAGDNASAIAIYRTVAAEKCMFPKKAKDAGAALKKLGAENIGEIKTAPNFDPAITKTITSLMKQGLAAENAGRYILAESFYSRAVTVDPADPTPLRYLAELHRHHIGNWQKAKREFHRILDMPSDPLSQAVALHGLGKITIHEGDFKAGLNLMERSVDTYPLALTYRNLAVYWNSEYNAEKGGYYTQKALELDPEDPYNIVFAAVYMAASGKKAEALKIATEHIDLLPASYNLAAIYAQAGQKERALELLSRHFYKYERYQEVRAKEMMEARVDAMFDSIRRDKDFLALTRFADGRLPIPMAPKAGVQDMNQ